ncbi:MAG: UDP-2,3-diacylglucosamine diphosphatase [Hyphomicrobiaceae bacterium]
MAQRYRALFISDVHLGTRGSRAAELLSFLKRTEAETIYLVGDIVDFWRIRRGLVWPEAHGDVLKEILRKAEAGTRVVFIPGNHDDGLRAYCGTRFGRIEVLRDTVHETASGRRYLVMHGDEYDVVVQRARWLALVGDRSYALALAVNKPFNWVRGQLGLEYWSLSAYLKNRVKSCVGRIGKFETALIEAAAANAADGVICGHIHRAASLKVGSIHYINIGDWVESCTAVVEQEDGQIEIIDGVTLAPLAESSRSGGSELEAAA